MNARLLSGCLLLVGVIGAVSCAAPTQPGAAAVGMPGAGPDCPAAPLNVVATANQYGSLALQLGGACVRVFNVISGADIDPHDY